MHGIHLLLLRGLPEHYEVLLLLSFVCILAHLLNQVVNLVDLESDFTSHAYLLHVLRQNDAFLDDVFKAELLLFQVPVIRFVASLFKQLG